jgi:hypothetical protein
MKSQSIILTTALLIASELAFAGTGGMGQESHHSGTDEGQAMGMSGCGMNMQQETNLYQHMEMMRSQMSEIMQTTDPARRQELMRAQMDSMDRMMHSMQNMHGDHSMMSQNSMMHEGNAMHGPDTQ